MFALSRDPDWMGVSPLLPHMRGLHLHAFESLTRLGKVGFFIGLPGEAPARQQAGARAGG